MNRFLLSLIACIVCVVPCVRGLSLEENFLLVEGSTGKVVTQMGPCLDKRLSPCCTFNIVLSLIGYDMGILWELEDPIWDFQAGYDDFRDAWRAPQSPSSWMKYSCVWFSKLLAVQIGQEAMQAYLALLEYGNQDLSGGLPSPGSVRPAWLNSSLSISLKEQVEFLRKMLNDKDSLSVHAVGMTRDVLFKEELPDGWRLYGKTGWTGSCASEHAWFVGWVEKDARYFPFAYLVRDKGIRLDQNVPRVIQLWLDASI